jgi:hypothetical protein
LAIDWLMPAIDALIWRIFPAQLNDSELIRGSLVVKLDMVSERGTLGDNLIFG